MDEFKFIHTHSDPYGIYNREVLMGRDRQIEWEEIIPKLPKLEKEHGLTHIKIAHQGKLFSLEAMRDIPPNLGEQKNVTFSEFIGPPKAGKTALLKTLSAKLDLIQIGHNVFPEKDIGFSTLDDPLRFNTVLQLQAASDMLAAATIATNYVEGYNKKFNFFDRGIFNPLPFIKASRKFSETKINEYDYRLPLAVIEETVGALSEIFIVKVPTNISLERGSKMERKYLESLSDAYNELPQEIADLTAESSDILPIIELDGTRPLEETADLALRTLGTLAEIRQKRNQQFKEWIDNNFGDSE